MGAFAVPATVLRLPRGPLGWRRLLVEGRGDCSRRLPWQVLQAQRPPRLPRTKVPLAVGGGRLRRQGPGLEAAEPSPGRRVPRRSHAGPGGRVAPAHRQRGYAMPADAAGRQRRLVARGQPDRSAELCSMCGGASIFCNTGSCYTTGTQMGDAYLYRVRCVRTITDDRRNINAATSEDLRAIQGIGKERAALVLGGIPYFAANDEQFESQLLRIDGVGQKTADKVVAAFYAPGLGECPKKVDESVCDVENDRGAPTFDECDPTDPCCTHADVADAEWCQRNCDDDYCPRSHCRCIPKPDTARWAITPNFRLDCGSGCGVFHLSPDGWPIVATVANCADKCLRTKGCVGFDFEKGSTSFRRCFGKSVNVYDASALIKATTWDHYDLLDVGPSVAGLPSPSPPPPSPSPPPPSPSSPPPKPSPPPPRPSPPPPPSPPPRSPSPTTWIEDGCVMRCENTCPTYPDYADDGYGCDDGGPTSDFSLCGEVGTDCGDCGPRCIQRLTPPSPPPPPPPSPPEPSPPPSPPPLRPSYSTQLFFRVELHELEETAASGSTVPGNVEWSYFIQDSYGPGRSRLYIDNRQFDSTEELSEAIAKTITSLQYLDLYDGPIVWKQKAGGWQVFEVASSLSMSTASRNIASRIQPTTATVMQPIRNMGSGNQYAVRADFSFTEEPTTVLRLRQNDGDVVYGHNDEIMVAPDTGVFICCQRAGSASRRRRPRTCSSKIGRTRASSSRRAELRHHSAEEQGVGLRAAIRLGEGAALAVRRRRRPHRPPAARLRMRSVSRAWRA